MTTTTKTVTATMAVLLLAIAAPSASAGVGLSDDSNPPAAKALVSTVPCTGGTVGARVDCTGTLAVDLAFWAYDYITDWVDWTICYVGSQFGRPC